MSIIALALTACTSFTEPCNTYFIDTAATNKICYTQMEKQEGEFYQLWQDINNPLPLKEWLKKQNISEEVAELVEVKFECVMVEEDELP